MNKLGKFLAGVAIVSGLTSCTECTDDVVRGYRVQEISSGNIYEILENPTTARYVTHLPGDTIQFKPTISGHDTGVRLGDEQVIGNAEWKRNVIDEDSDVKTGVVLKDIYPEE